MAELLQMAQANAEVVLRCVIARPRAFMMHVRYRCSNQYKAKLSSTLLLRNFNP